MKSTAFVILSQKCAGLFDSKKSGAFGWSWSVGELLGYSHKSLDILFAYRGTGSDQRQCF
jgi:hypothetical protein